MPPASGRCNRCLLRGQNVLIQVSFLSCLTSSNGRTAERQQSNSVVKAASLGKSTNNSRHIRFYFSCAYKVNDKQQGPWLRSIRPAVQLQLHDIYPRTCKLYLGLQSTYRICGSGGSALPAFMPDRGRGGRGRRTSLFAHEPLIVPEQPSYQLYWSSIVVVWEHSMPQRHAIQAQAPPCHASQVLTECLMNSGLRSHTPSTYPHSLGKSPAPHHRDPLSREVSPIRFHKIFPNQAGDLSALLWNSSLLLDLVLFGRGWAPDFTPVPGRLAFSAWKKG